MTSQPTGLSLQLKARAVGLCYLLTIGFGAFDHLVVGRGMVVTGDAGATARNILASEPLYRVAFVLDTIPLYVVVTVLLYQLLKPVNAGVSLLAAFTSLMGGAVGSAIAVLQWAPLVILGSASYLAAFAAGQRQALAMLSLDLHGVGFVISLVFFGFYCALIGWLILRSGFIPWFVGALMMTGGLAYAAYSFTDLLFPSLAASLTGPTLMLGSLGEGVLTLWLLIFGLNTKRWLQAAAA